MKRVMTIVLTAVAAATSAGAHADETQRTPAIHAAAVRENVAQWAQTVSASTLTDLQDSRMSLRTSGEPAQKKSARSILCNRENQPLPAHHTRPDTSSLSEHHITRRCVGVGLFMHF